MVGLPEIGALLAVQIIWGALVAGLKAGLFHNTFPLMGGALVPAAAWGMDPWIRNLFENPIAVQWVHRVVGTLLGDFTLLHRVPVPAGVAHQAAAMVIFGVWLVWLNHAWHLRVTGGSTPSGRGPAAGGDRW